MLSRVAERLYWMARYIERAENIARMTEAFHLLALDMPRTETLSWRGLVAVSGLDAIFEEHYQREDERNCVKFLLADTYNPGSILSSLRAARENVRTTRDLVPTAAWEIVNELYIFARDNVDAAIGKRGRFEFLTSIVGRCQMLTGMLAGGMSHDAAYDFIRLGRNLERTDMATRQIDVGAIKLLSRKDTPEPYEGLLWTSVLRSQSGFQMYRQHVRRRITGPDVVRFLLQDLAFPRAVAHAINQSQIAISNLPRNATPLRYAMQARRHALDADVDKLIASDGLHDFMDQLQLDIAQLHGAIAGCWFPQAFDDKPTTVENVTPTA
ncbi:alpha-E domain-containing protein [Azoarcus sp. L1K30]|uniref:alpha-E domain-containing protein n=1 Tax=Azoarcus sp. L1K30 TaxID=2820277 RepID=UPI001B831C5D|nr:alpha-E domain-containing protein [Azoarcus sp. L1K30]MBR0564706.1 alpha-E domain-containing protein [Azoarcus sp. L1K30]